LSKGLPRALPNREDRRRAGDAQPCDSQHIDLGEQKNGEGRTEIVKNRTDQKIKLRRNASSPWLHPRFLIAQPDLGLDLPRHKIAFGTLNRE